jgi:hypothetical protein
METEMVKEEFELPKLPLPPEYEPPEIVSVDAVFETKAPLLVIAPPEPITIAALAMVPEDVRKLLAFTFSVVVLPPVFVIVTPLRTVLIGVS